MSDEYVYAVARVRSKELTLLNEQDIDQLMASKSFDEAMKLLADKGWGDGTQTTAESILSFENKKTWSFINELTKDLTPFEVLLLPNDYNNLKAAIKSVVTQTTPHNVYYQSGAIPVETIVKAAEEGDFSSLPESMRVVAKEAYTTFIQTGDGQLCDAMLDRACLVEMYDTGKKSKNEVIEKYTELFVAVTNIKIAVRCAKTGKSLSFIEASLAPCDTLDVKRLAEAASKSIDEVYKYLDISKYSEAADAIKHSSSAFEKWCDDKIMSLIKEQKTNPFTIGPLFAYVIARQNEISIVRIILSGKTNELPDEIIRERLRDMYV